MNTAADIALAFNQQNEKKGWTARTNSRPDSGMDIVHFSAPSGLVSLAYNTMDRRFHVKFHKLQATWGDYIKAIAKAMYYVLTTLKSAGLPFDAPPSYAGMQITCTATEDSTVYVEWPGMHRDSFAPVVPPPMSEDGSLSVAGHAAVGHPIAGV